MTDKIKSIFADIFDVNIESINEHFSSETVESWDSINKLRMITALEEAFDVQFTMDEIGQMEDLHKVVAAVQSHLAK
jgi:acyl carrier protein